MDRFSLERKARKHWAEWLPNKVASLQAEGKLAEAVQGAATAAQRMSEDLMAQGFRSHEAEEVALKELILLPPEEGANLAPWERAELDEQEKADQSMMAE